MLYDITSDIHTQSVTWQFCELAVHDFIYTCNIIETAIDCLDVGCLLAFLMELLHFNSPL